MMLGFEECLDDCVKIVELGFANQYNVALETCEKLSSTSLYHSFCKTVLLGFKDALSMEKEDLEATIKSGRETNELCDKYRKQQSFVWKWIVKPDYTKYTEEQIHAELLKALNHWIVGLSLFFVDQSIFNLVKGLLQLRAGHSLLKSCSEIMEEGYEWKTESARINFLGGLQIGQGLINLFLSHMPDKFMMLCNWAGYSCNIQDAYALLEKCANEGAGLFSKPAKVLYCLYETEVVTFFGVNNIDLMKVARHANTELSGPNQSAWFLLIKAKVFRLSGELDHAIYYYNKAIESQNELKQMLLFCYWDLSWVHGFKQEWDKAAHYAQLLYEQCNWSRATFMYMKAAFLYMKMIEENKPEMKNDVTELFRLVPQLKQRFAGKTIPPEKYVCVNAEKYFKQNQSLPLPVLDLFYIWNVYSTAKCKPELVDPFIERIEKVTQSYLDEKSQVEYHIENHLLLLLVKGVCFRIKGQFTKAENCFKAILKSEDNLDNSEKHLLAMTSLEMGLTKLSQNCFTEAEKWFKGAKNNYSGYLFEMMNLMRIHSGQQRLKEIAKNNDKMKDDN